MLEERLAPEVLLDRALDALGDEENELLLARILGLVEGIYWRFLPEETRRTVAPRVEEVLWNGLEVAQAPTVRASFFSTWADVTTTADGVARMRRIWSGEEAVPGVPLSESQEIALAEGLAVRGIPDAEAVLDTQAERIANPDRKARFDFVRPSLSADPAVREAFFHGLEDPVNREREPWALAGMGYLQHPLRRAHGATLVRPALELMEEIQVTGDIFFPTRWAATTLGSHNEPEVVETVTAYLDAHPELPPRLRGKVLQPADGVRRAARIVYGAEAAREWSVEW
jgi:aminopeptidase N